jgi:GNAT superfamily N-acetyltransferase
MLWAFRQFLFSYKAPGLFFKSLPDVAHLSARKTSTDAFSISRVGAINNAFEKRFNHTISGLDYKLPFTLSEAQKRLDRNEIFFVINHEESIVGWVWYALNQADCTDLGCSIRLRKGHAYAYNVFISKTHRGSGLAARILLATECDLINMGITDIWAIIYNWNISSQKAFFKAGYSKIGYCRALNILGMKYRRFPAIISG